ncbi:MAG: DUF2493 domain-containing protein [Clostridia bacterium]|nr:DUF2493 domain-containing protein [Clostridia bacterium]
MIKRIVVAGCRDFNDYNIAERYISNCISRIKNDYELRFVSGGCRGADMLGERFANENGYKIERHTANWELYGRSAGPKRNKEMVEVSDYVICFWDGKSKGTKTTIEFAKRLKKELRVKMVVSF